MIRAGPLALALAACYDPALMAPAVDAPVAPKDASLDAPVCAQQPASCTAIPIADVCFYVCGRTVTVSFADARTSCETMLAGCPASLTKTESEALRSRLALEAEVEQAWIGLVRVDSDDAGPSDGWRWVCDDQPLEATEDDWASGEPNDGAGGEDCTISTAPGWVDRPCSDLHPFVCLAE